MNIIMRNISLALIILSLFAVFIACGKGKRVSSGTSFSTASVENPVTIVQGGSESEGGLRQTVEFDYDLEEYPSEDGFTVVPMETDRCASSILRDRISLSVKGTEENKSVELNVNGIENPTLHFRYDPDRWEVTGVSSTGLYGDGKYLFMAAIAKSGVLVIHAEPAGRDTHISATGKVAEVQLAPKGTMRRTSEVADNPPGNIDSLTVAWYAWPVGSLTMYTSNTVSFCMDGSPGIFSGKDGRLDSTERSAYVYDNVVHDVKYDASTMILSWKERLQGDYNNDGEVTVADLTPMAWLYGEGQGAPIPYARGAVVDEYNVIHDLKDEMRTFGWLLGPYPLYSYYYNDEENWTDPGDFVGEYSSYNDGYGLTDRDTALDGFMDGYVFPYQNLAPDNQSLPNGFWTSPETEVYQPGDIAPIEAHYLEKIDGYRVLTVPNTMLDGVWRTDPYGGGSDGVFVIGTYVRERKDIDPTGLIEKYSDRPWANHEYIDNKSDEVLRKANFNLTLTTESFEVVSDIDEYDIVIEPFIFEDPDSTEFYSDMLFGPITRIINAYTYTEIPPPTDLRGPEYFIGESSTSSPPADGGLWTITQDSQYSLSGTYMDADDVDANGIRSTMGPITYRLHGLVIDDPNDPPTEEEFFSSNLLYQWNEPNGGDLNTTRPLPALNPKLIPSLASMLSNPGDLVWFGVRAYYAYMEYEGNQSYTANTRIVPLIVQDMTKPHFVAPEDFHNISRRNTKISYAAQTYKYNNAIRIFFNPAIDPPKYSDSDMITYSLYLSDDREDLDDLSLINPIDTDTRSASSFFNYNQIAHDWEFNPDVLKFDVYADDWDLVVGTTYYYCITATDSSNHVSDVDVIEETGLRDFEDDSITITEYHQGDSPYIPGDMLVNDGSVYLLYVEDPPIPNWEKLVVFRKILTGCRDIQYWLPCETIQDENNYYHTTVPYERIQMCAQIDQDGVPLVDSSGVLCPLVSTYRYNNTIGYEFPTCTYRTEIDNDTKWVRESPVIYGTTIAPLYCGTGIGALQVSVDEQSIVRYFLGWVVDDLLDVSDEYGSLVNVTRTNETNQYGYYLPWTYTDEIEYSPTEYLRKPNQKGSEITVRTLHNVGATSEPIVNPGGGSSNADKMYMLCSVARCGDDGRNPWLSSKIWWTSDPSDWSTSRCVDLKEALSNYGAPSETSFGPNALEVVPEVNSPGNAYVYTAYNGASLGSAGWTGKGLKTAFSRDIGSGPKFWAPYSGYDVIDESYYYPYTNGERLSCDQVDLRHKQSVMELENYTAYAGLGCAYIHPDSRIYYAQSTASGWEPVPITPGPDGSIDEGQIVWTKLIYNYESEGEEMVDVPYILYVVKTDLEEDEDPPVYYLKLWTPED